MSGSAERMRRLRERKAEEEAAVRRVEDPTVGMSEQEVRDFWGYSKTETRSKAERDAAAARIVAGDDDGLAAWCDALWRRKAEEEAGRRRAVWAARK